MADKEIVVKKRRGCGCISSTLLIILASVAFTLYLAKELFKSNGNAGNLDSDDPTSRSFPEKLNDAYIISYHIEKGLRGHLLAPDSYKPIGSPRWYNHPKGRAYFQDFTAKNALGGSSRQVAGLLFCTNKSENAWTFYAPATVPQLLDECQVNGAK